MAKHEKTKRGILIWRYFILSRLYMCLAWMYSGSSWPWACPPPILFIPLEWISLQTGFGTSDPEELNSLEAHDLNPPFKTMAVTEGEEKSLKQTPKNRKNRNFTDSACLDLINGEMAKWLGETWKFKTQRFTSYKIKKTRFSILTLIPLQPVRLAPTLSPPSSALSLSLSPSAPATGIVAVRLSFSIGRVRLALVP